MLKLLLVAQSNNTLLAIKDKLQAVSEIKIVASGLIAEKNALMQFPKQYDLIVTDEPTLMGLCQAPPSIHQPRQQIKASTHQGIVLVPLENIYYFQAEHKYVTIYHTQGQLLIEDSLNSLEREFNAIFMRIHRRTLVAKHKVEMLNKDEEGKFYIKLRDKDDKLMVSRRQLAQVRKILVCL